MEGSLEWTSAVLRDVFANFLFSQGNLPLSTTLAVRSVCRSWRDNVFTLSVTVPEVLWISRPDAIVGAAKHICSLQLADMSPQSLAECAILFGRAPHLREVVFDRAARATSALKVVLQTMAAKCRLLRSVKFLSCSIGPGDDTACEMLVKSPYCPQELLFNEHWISPATLSRAFSTGRVSSRLERLELHLHASESNQVGQLLSSLHGGEVPPNALKVLRISVPRSFNLPLELIFKVLNNNNTLEELYLAGLRVGEGPEDDFQFFSNTRLRVFSVPCYDSGDSRGLISLCTLMKALEYLDVGGKTLGLGAVSACKQLLSPERASPLQTLILDRCQILADHMGFLFQALSDSPNLRVLSLEGVLGRQSGGCVLGRLSEARNLISLNVSNSNLPLAEEKELARLITSRRTLKVLRASKCGISSYVDPLAAEIETSQSLEEFDISGNPMEAKSVASLARALRSSPHLKSVNLAYTNLAFPSVTDISEMVADCPSLTHLSLAGNEFNDDCLEVLCSGLKASSSLSSLVLTVSPCANNGISLLSEYLRSTRTLGKIHLLVGSDPRQKEKDLLLTTLCENQSLWSITLSVPVVARWTEFAAAVRRASQRIIVLL